MVSYIRRPLRYVPTGRSRSLTKLCTSIRSSPLEPPLLPMKTSYELTSLSREPTDGEEDGDGIWVSSSSRAGRGRNRRLLRTRRRQQRLPCVLRRSRTFPF